MWQAYKVNGQTVRFHKRDSSRKTSVRQKIRRCWGIDSDVEEFNNQELLPNAGITERKDEEGWGLRGNKTTFGETHGC